MLTSYFRRVFGRHRWKQLHYVAYAAAAVFYVHGVWADPLLKNRPVDFIDAEKAYVEGCALLVVGATVCASGRGPDRGDGVNGNGDHGGNGNGDTEGTRSHTEARRNRERTEIFSVASPLLRVSVWDPVAPVPLRSRSLRPLRYLRT